MGIIVARVEAPLAGQSAQASAAPRTFGCRQEESHVNPSRNHLTIGRHPKLAVIYLNSEKAFQCSEQDDVSQRHPHSRPDCHEDRDASGGVIAGCLHRGLRYLLPNRRPNWDNTEYGGWLVC
jgi:hypothetical protein